MVARAASSSPALRGRTDAWRSVAVERWRALARREQTAVIVAASLVALVLVWMLGVQPAWRTWREAPARIEALDTQLQFMQALATEAGSLKGAAPVSQSQARAALEAATSRLGTVGRLNVQGDRATLTLTGVDAPMLREWLEAARSAARARPVEAQLTRSGDAYAGTLTVSMGTAP
jgi:general secretion pathway protein M